MGRIVYAPLDAPTVPYLTAQSDSTVTDPVVSIIGVSDVGG